MAEYTEKEIRLQHMLNDSDINVVDYFLSNIKFDENTFCWNWKGAKLESNYGMVSFLGSTYYTHRVSYVIFNGMIDKNMVIDHLCHNKLCCNPEHLEMITRADNTRRSKQWNGWWGAKTHCSYGHELTNSNTTKNNECRICVNKRSRLSKFRKTIKIDWVIA